MFDERISKESSEFERRRLLLLPNQLASVKQGENAEAFSRDLSLPADPNEGY
jgi:hypothetical protein